VNLCFCVCIGDLFYDVEGREKEIQQWFQIEIQEKAKKEKGIHVQLFLLHFDNVAKKPGPVFNYLTQTAYNDGVNYIYRINDDTILKNEKWTSIFIQRLHEQGKKAAGIITDTGSSSSSIIFGVVGPACHVGNGKILTHDFVHRQHLDIFSSYYPESLSDWWMDDWISRVYGPMRTTRLKEVEVGHSAEHGTRYEIEMGHQELLPKEVQIGRTKIEEYMNKVGVDEETKRKFQQEPQQFSLV